MHYQKRVLPNMVISLGTKSASNNSGTKVFLEEIIRQTKSDKKRNQHLTS